MQYRAGTIIALALFASVGAHVSYAVPCSECRKDHDEGDKDCVKQDKACRAALIDPEAVGEQAHKECVENPRWLLLPPVPDEAKSLVCEVDRWLAQTPAEAELETETEKCDIQDTNCYLRVHHVFGNCTQDCTPDSPPPSSGAADSGTNDGGNAGGGCGQVGDDASDTEGTESMANAVPEIPEERTTSTVTYPTQDEDEEDPEDDCASGETYIPNQGCVADEDLDEDD